MSASEALLGPRLKACVLCVCVRTLGAAERAGVLRSGVWTDGMPWPRWI